MILEKLKKKISKYKKKPTNDRKKPALTTICPEIKPVYPFNQAVFDHINTISGQKKDDTQYMRDFVSKSAQSYKKLTLDNQLKALFYYIKLNSKESLYKRPGFRTMGEAFGVQKNTIQKRFELLEEKGYIRTLTELELKQAENTYKLLRDKY